MNGTKHRLRGELATALDEIERLRTALWLQQRRQARGTTPPDCPCCNRHQDLCVCSPI